MSLAPNKISYHDLGSLQQIRSTASKDKAGALRQAAEQFESIFFSMLLSSMRKANEAFEADGMMNSQTTSFYRDMQDSQMATELSQNGALGLADLLVQQLSPAMGIKATMAEPVVHSLHNETSRALAMPKIILPAVKVSAKAQDKVPEQEPLLPLNAAINVATGPQRVQSPLAVAAETPAQSEHKQDSASWQVSSPAEFVKSILPAARQTAKTLGLDPIALVAGANACLRQRRARIVLTCLASKLIMAGREKQRW
jgi:peptidoglycan hydrolase FlgJ